MARMNSGFPMERPAFPASRPAISVVVPVYRVPESYLRPCAESISAQDFASAEFLFVLDGPDPDAAALLRGIFGKDNRFRLEILSSNGGVSRARNAALAQIRGEYFCFLDADDRLPPGVLGKVGKAMEENPGTDVFIGLCSGGGEERLHARRCFFPPPCRESVPLDDANLARFTVWSEASACWKFYSSRLLPHAFLGELRRYEDACFVWQILRKAGSTCFLPFPVYSVVSRPGSASRSELSESSRLNALRGLLELARMPLPPRGGKALLRVRQARLLVELFASCLLGGLSGKTATPLLPAVREIAGIISSPPYPRLAAPMRWIVRRRISSPAALARPGRIQQVLFWDAYRLVTAGWRSEPPFLSVVAVIAPPLYRKIAPRFAPLP